MITERRESTMFGRQGCDSYLNTLKGALLGIHFILSPYTDSEAYSDIPGVCGLSEQ